MGIGVLGTLTVDDAPEPRTHRDRVVLSALATSPGRVVSLDALADALWREHPPASAAKVLQGCISRLRRLLGAEAIRTSSPGYRLTVADEALDSVRFERTVARARDLAAVGQTDRAAHLVDEALALWRGRPFPDVEDWEPAVIEAGRLEEVRREAEELRVDCYLRAGRHHEVLADASALLRAAPSREARWGLLARAQYQDGRQAEALATLKQARELLGERLGIDPGPELARLHEAMLRQDPELLPEEQVAVTGAPCPYRGLAAYDVGDAETFFGRDAEVAACLETLDRHGVVVVVGPSGSGKSSVVRAGVAATLAGRGLRVHVITPGEVPVRVLEALPRRSHRDALVVDQCEEVFSLCADEDQRREFVDRLVAHAENAPLVVALRADRLAEVAPYPTFARLLEQGLHLLGAMDETSLREVIETPARQAGLLLEPGLVDLLVREVEGEPGALPLLSHALQETWLRREGNTLTVAGYQATGGIRGAVAQTAETVYAGVDPTQRHLMRELMLRLVSAGSEGEASRVRAPRARVIVEPAQERLVDELVAARLLTSEEGVIEIAHESLARAWPRLRDWLDEDVEGQRILHHVSSAADAWDALGRPDSELYRGTRLQQALGWRDRGRVELTPLEDAFLDAGRVAAEAEEQALADRSRHQARLIRRQRIALAAGSVFLVLALAASGVALRQSDRARAGERAAEVNELTAEANERAAQAGRIGARALTVEDPSLALLLAVEGVRVDDNAQTRGYLREAMARRPELVASTEPGPSVMMGISVDDRRNDVVAYGVDNTVYRFDLGTGKQRATFDLDGPDVERSNRYATGEVDGAGSLVAVGESNYTDHAVWLLDRETLEPLPDQPTELPASAKVAGLDLSSDGRWLAAALEAVEPGTGNSATVDFAPQYALVWDVSRLSRPPRRVPLPDKGYGWVRVQISDDGRTLYAASPPTAIDVRTKEELWSRPDRAVAGGSRIDLSDSGRLLATAYNGVTVLDTQSGDDVARFGEAQGVEWSADVRFSPDGSRLAATDESRVYVWDVATGHSLLRADEGEWTQVDYSSDRDVLHVSGPHGVETWDLAGGQQFLRRLAAPAFLSKLFTWSLNVSPDGAYYAAVAVPEERVSGASDVALVATDTGETVRRVRETVDVGEFRAEAWSPDGSTFAVGTTDGEVVTIPLRGPVRRFTADDGDIVAIDATPDGRHLVVLGESGVLRRFTTSGEVAGPAVRVGARGADVTVAPGGRTALVLVGDPPLGPQELVAADTWALVDLVAGTVSRTGPLPESPDDYGWERADFPSGGEDRVALSGRGGIQVLDLTTGRPAGGRVAAHTDYAVGRYTTDGSMVVSGTGDAVRASADGRVVLWDGEDGHVLDVAMIERGAWVAPAMLPDGHTVVVVTPDSIYRWDTRIEKAVKAACRAAGRSMTDVEWRTNVGDDIPYHATCG